VSKKISVSKAIGEAMHEEMEKDKNVIIWVKIWALWVTYLVLPKASEMNLVQTEYMILLFPSPVSAAWQLVQLLRGMRPIVELMYNDFMTVCADPILNQAAKMRYMTGGQ